MTLPPEAVAVGLLLLPLLAGGLLILLWPPPPPSLRLRSGSVLVCCGGQWRRAAVSSLSYRDQVRYRGVEYVVTRWERPSWTEPVTVTLSRC